MAVNILTELSFLLNHLSDFQALFPFEKSLIALSLAQRLGGCLSISRASLFKKKLLMSVWYGMIKKMTFNREISPCADTALAGDPAILCALVSWSLFKSYHTETYSK
jgi:hypothetical protein